MPVSTAGSGSGTPGADGKSAYQVAVDNGFVGTESAWLLSLIGADGGQGIQGNPGSDASVTKSNVEAVLTGTITSHSHSGSASWGGIGGTLSNQTDLNSALSGKADSTHSHAPADVTGTAVITTDSRLADARTPTAHTQATSTITGLDTALSGKEAANANIQTHVTSAHAPSGAQANADITKAEIEAKLTGAITSHSHTGGGGQPIGLTVLANDTLAQELATNINTQITVTAARTLTTTVPAAGTRCAVKVLTSGTSSFVITFGSGFKPTGTLATGTTTNRVFIINWISDGTNLYEAGRTAAMAA